MIVQVTTPYGDRYHIDTTTGQLIYIRRNGPTTRGSSQWTITGISYTDQRFGQSVPGQLQALEDLTKPDADVLTRTGKPRYTLCDLDHGAARVHGNPEYHGILRVERMPADYQLPIGDQ